MPLLDIRDLKKSFRTGEAALGGVSLSVESTEVIALLGLSGSGKSTLLRCINRLVEPDSGTVTLGDVEITALRPRDLRRMRRSIGMIFQEFNLVNRLSVLENVLSGCLASTPLWRCATRAFRREDIARAIDLCERVGLVDHIRKRADELSGGQRQRVGIARALMQQPKIILADEPTSSLDPIIGREVMDLMTSLAKENGVPLMVSVHDLELATAYSSRIIGLQAGRKVLDVSTGATDRSMLHRIYTTQLAA
jgi:phosphonate transport system ATP-binding protein